MRTAAVCIVLAVFALLPMLASDGPTITIYTDAVTYHTGDTIEVSLSAENDDEGMSVDVYIGLLTPDGALYTLGGLAWSENINPWIENIYVPAGLDMDGRPFWWFSIPCEMPPIQDYGIYSFAAGLTHPGTLEFLSEIDLPPFWVLHAPVSDYYVDAELGDDDNDGLRDTPWRRIIHALGSVRGSEAIPVTIHIAPGIYSYTTNGETFPLRMRDYVSLAGDDRETTVLDAGGFSSSVIFCANDEDVSIQGCTITGGDAYGRSSGDGRGGIFCQRCSPTIKGNIIIGNSGSGLYCEDGSPVIEDNIITHNSAGIGIHCESDNWVMIIHNAISDNNGYGISYGGYASSSAIRGNTITGNSASGLNCYGSAHIEGNTISDNGGAGIYCRGDRHPVIHNNVISSNSIHGIYCQNSATIVGNMISGNAADDYYGEGGGIYCSGSSSPLIMENTIVGNSATTGGGIYCDYSSPTIRDNIIKDNTAENAGGLCCYDSSPAIQSNTITGNWAELRGGGIYCYMSACPVIWDNTIADNSADEGGGICCEHYSSPTIRNNIFAGNSADRYGGGICCMGRSWPRIANNTVTRCSANDGGGAVYFHDERWTRIINCIVWENGDAPYNCSALYCCIDNNNNGEGNIHENPMFVLGPLGEYYLDPDSPCIDAGSQSAEEAGLSDRTTQADGTPDTGTVDMGYHYPLP